MATSVLRLHPDDNVLIALRDLHTGEQVDLAGRSLVLTSDVPAKHKFAVQDLPPDAPVLMYGVLVGKATQPIPKGSILTTRNIRHETLPFREKPSDYRWSAPDVSAWQSRT